MNNSAPWTLIRVARVCDRKEFPFHGNSYALNFSAQPAIAGRIQSTDSDYLGSTRTTVPSPAPWLNIVGVSASVSK